MTKYSLNVHVISQIILNCVVKVLYSATFLNEICLISFVLLIMFVNFYFATKLKDIWSKELYSLPLICLKLYFLLKMKEYHLIYGLIVIDIGTHHNQAVKTYLIMQSHLSP